MECQLIKQIANEKDYSQRIIVVYGGKYRDSEGKSCEDYVIRIHGDLAVEDR